jgi:hypothetical protein
VWLSSGTSRSHSVGFAWGFARSIVGSFCGRDHRFEKHEEAEERRFKTIEDEVFRRGRR